MEDNHSSLVDGILLCAGIFCPVWDSETGDILEGGYRPTLCDGFNIDTASVFARVRRGSGVVHSWVSDAPWRALPDGVFNTTLAGFEPLFLSESGGEFYELDHRSEDYGIDPEVGRAFIERLVAPLKNIVVRSTRRCTLSYKDCIEACWVVRLSVQECIGRGPLDGVNIMVDDEGNFLCSDFCQRQDHDSSDDYEGQQDGTLFTLVDWLLGPATELSSRFGSAAPGNGKISHFGFPGEVRFQRSGKGHVLTEWERTLNLLRMKLRSQ